MNALVWALVAPDGYRWTSSHVGLPEDCATMMRAVEGFARSAGWQVEVMYEEYGCARLFASAFPAGIPTTEVYQP